MNTEEIIKSGMLTQYLLGNLPDEEVRMLEKKLQEDAALSAHLQQLEADLETLAFENAIEAPNTVKENILASIHKTSPKAIPLQQEPKKSRSYVLPVAASLAFLFLLSSFWLYNQLNTAAEDLKVAQEELRTIKEQVVGLQNSLKTTDAIATIIKDPNTIPLALKRKGKETLVTAYINHNTKSAVINPKKLPSLEKDKCYQMWADVEGEMIDMGVIDTSKDVIAMKYIDDATSLNITIEPVGGNDHATVDQLVTNVYLTP